jgi:VanZ family protein
MTKAKAATLSQLALAGYWLLLFAATHLPATTPFLPGHRFDKLYHGAAFAILAVLLASVWTLTFGRASARALAVILALLALYAVVDEFTQIAVGRNSSIYDWLADMTGAAVGMGLFVGVRGKLDARELHLPQLQELQADREIAGETRNPT